MPGICTSMSTRSGSSSATRTIAAAPQPPPPPYSRPPSTSSRSKHMMMRPGRSDMCACMCVFPALPSLSDEVNQRGLDATTDVFGVSELELHEDAVDVPLDGPLRQEELRGDRRVAAALGDQCQDLELTRRQPVELCLLARPCRLEQRVNDGWIDVRAAGRHRPNDLGEKFSVRETLLEQIRPSIGPFLQERHRIGGVAVLREHDDPDLRV